MPPHFQLLVHNIAAIVSAVVFAGIALFTFLNGPRKRANILFALSAISADIFFISHVIGVNIADPELSRQVLMFNLAMLFIGVFHLHVVFVLTGQEQARKFFLILSYSGAVFLTLFFVVFQDLLFLPSVPKMYFPNYYQPGVLNWVRVVFLDGIYVPLLIGFSAAAYIKAKSAVEKNKYWYFIFASIVGYGLGLIPNLLVYDWQVNPLWGMFAAVFAIPLIFGMVKHNLFDVNLVAKQAFGYSLVVFVVGGFAVAFNYLNSELVKAVPSFPYWIVPFVSSVVVVTMSVFIWRFTRSADILRYEFIEVATHKFRTPLTQIKWAAESILEQSLTPEQKSLANHIVTANGKLVELTNLLTRVSGSEREELSYRMRLGDLSTVVSEVLLSLEPQFKVKGLNIERRITPGLFSSFDSGRLKFVIQVFLENAVHYTPKGGKVEVAFYRNAKNVTFSVKDNGIGINKGESHLIFSKFYRSRSATLADTEGLGVGLFLSKQIIETHRGKIWAESAGLNRGSTFTFSLPVGK